MSFDPDPIDDEVPPDPPGVPPVHMVSFRFLRAALRRQRGLWIGLALAGLAVGVAYHLVVPVRYTATAALYLAAPPGTDQTVASADNLAMLNTAAVGQRAIDQLGEPHLTPAGLLGKEPGTAVSDNVLAVTVSGPTRSEAVRRANAVAGAFLAFRTQQYEAQNQAVVRAAGRQISRLRAQITSLTGQIDAAASGTTGQATTGLVAQRAADTAQVTNLQQQIETDDFDTLSMTRGSRVITAGTLVATSEKKVLLLDGLTGLAAGLALGLAVVVLQAVLSDRLRRREDVAAALGVPVAVSTGRAGSSWLGYRRRRSPAELAAAPDRQLLVLVRYLQAQWRGRGRRTELVVAVDDPAVPGAALVALARALGVAGHRVVLVDDTAGRVLARSLPGRRVLGAAGGPDDPAGPNVPADRGQAATVDDRVAERDRGEVGEVGEGAYQAWVGPGTDVTLVVPAEPWARSAGATAGEPGQAALDRADAVLVLATVDPSGGAWHLGGWGAADAVVTVTAGRSTAERVGAVGELLSAAGVPASAAALLDADADDESVGLPEHGVPAPSQQPGLVEAEAAMLA